MKLKYYLRGIGAGILFATIILSVSYRLSSKAQLSDDEIIKRAEELGMVKQSDINMDDLIAPSVTPTANPSPSPSESPAVQPTDTTSAETTKEMPAGAPSANITEENQAGASAKPTESPTPVPSKAAGEYDNVSGTAAESGDNYVLFEIVTGMTSEDVANLLKEKGIVEDARAFNQYLKQNNYTTEINVGKFQIEKFASYQEITDIIVNK